MMTPPDLDAAVRLARARVDKGDWHEPQDDAKIAAALLALEPLYRAALKLDAINLTGHRCGSDKPCAPCDFVEARDAIATARRGGG
jgi:hypothetical protein